MREVSKQYPQPAGTRPSVFQSIFVSSIGITNACKDTLRTHNLTTSSRKIRDNTRACGRGNGEQAYSSPSEVDSQGKRIRCLLDFVRLCSSLSGSQVMPLRPH